MGIIDQSARSDTERLNKIIEGSDNIVFFGGAGVSTESGIPDFRSAGGLYNKTDGDASVPPETMLSHSFFIANTELFFTFYKKKMMYLDAKPNKAHIKLAEMERAGKLRAVITQNIDGLHQQAGSKNVIELHGSIYRNYCMICKKAYDAQYISQSGGMPLCGCGGVIKPDVVLYEENLNTEDISRATGFIAKSDVLIIGGTSLAVYPAAGLVDYYRGGKLIIINKSKTGSDGRALLAFRKGIAEVLDEVVVSGARDR